MKSTTLSKIKKKKKKKKLIACISQCISDTLLQQYNTNFMSVQSLHYEVSNNHMIDQWHPFKSDKFIDNLAKYEKQYSPWWDAITTVSSRLQHHKFYLSTTHIHFSSIPIGCHVAPTNLSAWSLVLEFCGSLYIHSNYLLFHIFAFINLTCFSMTKNLLVYWLNTAQFCCE